VEPPARFAPVTIARIVRTRGNRGEVLVELHTDFPERFRGLREVWLEFADGRRERLALARAWDHQGRMVLHFEGVNSITAAEALVGAWVQVDSGEAVAPAEGQFFNHDLVGCEVRDLSGKLLGSVADVLHISGNNLLIVSGPQGEIMIPAAAGFCVEISIERQQIVVDLPEGLVDLNR
jgi:16S rRNA processing protein RimM